MLKIGSFDSLAKRNLSIFSDRPATPSGNFFQYGQNWQLRAPKAPKSEMVFTLVGGPAGGSGAEINILFKHKKTWSSGPGLFMKCLTTYQGSIQSKLRCPPIGHSSSSWVNAGCRAYIVGSVVGRPSDANLKSILSTKLLFSVALETEIMVRVVLLDILTSSALVKLRVLLMFCNVKIPMPMAHKQNFRMPVSCLGNNNV